MSIVSHVQEILSQSGNRSEESPELPQQPSLLYHCDACRETYISEGMDCCPSCDTAVENVPSERDLGFV